jgi:hypothetical protein
MQMCMQIPAVPVNETEGAPACNTATTATIANQTVQSSPASGQLRTPLKVRESTSSAALSDFVYQPPSMLLDWRLVCGLSTQVCPDFVTLRLCSLVGNVLLLSIYM